MPVLPFPIPWRKVQRDVRRRVRKLQVHDLDTCRRLESQVLLDQIRQGARVQARAGGRPSRGQMFAYACKPEARRVSRALAYLADREASLCG